MMSLVNAVINTFTIKNGFDYQVDDICADISCATESRSSADCWNSELQSFHHGIIIAGVIHHEWSQLGSNVVPSENHSHASRNVRATVTFQGPRQTEDSCSVDAICIVEVRHYSQE